ncbi:hypothetical protein [Paraburkholderia sp. BR14312]|uniref:hypothetical protein n=1 Tax=unclassified Paraburkholderia TaxID=2615204 RepID=UPI0034CD9B0F
MRYYHGGAGHLQRGQYLLQPKVVTTDAHAAFDDAATVRAPTVAVYEVIPASGRARIVRVVQVLTQEERDAALQRLGK